jgi:glyoxylase-like metal-dependent hydrolase (beta-lactamase superfamily II)/ferredoxin
VARVAERLAENAPGSLFVDASCIDCDACRQIAPAVFARSDASGQSFVALQPDGDATRRRAAMALVACPTASIGDGGSLDVRAAARAFPEPIDGEVAYAGYAAASSFGASSYFVRRPAGNLLVDSPRAARPLLERLADAGGVALLFLTHRDDVADHDKLARRFGCRRILHEADVDRDTAAVEQRLHGADPVPLADDLLAIPVPGHTAGSTALLYREQFLFSGDHLWGDDDGHLHASRSVCWHSWPAQLRSVEKLLDHRFEWLLPGHGRRFRAKSARAMRDELERLLGRLRRR